MRQWSTERLTNLFIVTQLIRSRNGRDAAIGCFSIPLSQPFGKNTVLTFIIALLKWGILIQGILQLVTLLTSPVTGYVFLLEVGNKGVASVTKLEKRHSQF